jgi:hypothetical protein
MRLDEAESRIANELAERFGCSQKEIVELSVRVVWTYLKLNPAGYEKLVVELLDETRRVKASHRGKPDDEVVTKPIKKLDPTTGSRPKKGLTHNPFLNLKKESK